MNGGIRENAARVEIMVVEDIPSDLKFLTGILKKEGYRVRPASDGELALRSIEAEAPSLILLDIKLPGIDGFEVCRRLKDSEESRGIPVIFISALSDPIDKIKALSLGGVDFVSKPFEPGEVLARVNTHLQNHLLQLKLETRTRELAAEIEERKRTEQALRGLSRSFEGLTGREYFERISRHLTETLGVDYAFVGVRHGEGLEKIKVAGGSFRGEAMELFEYELAGTPYNEVMEKQFCCFPSGVQELFPEDDDLGRLNIEGYMGMPLLDRHSDVLGIMVIMNEGPISNPGVAESTFRIFTDRVVAEIERANSERALRESEAVYRAVVEDMPVMVCRFKPDGAIVFANEAACTFFGTTSETLIGSDFFQFIPESNRESVVTVISALSVKSPVESVEFQITEEDDETRWHHWTYRALFNAENKVSAFQSVGQDISKRKQDEQERLSLERQIQQAQKLESLGVMAGGIAHDFNNILMSILGNADLALQDLKPHAPSRDRIQQIETAARRAAGLSQQMLAYSGKGNFVIEPINLNQFVEEMDHLLGVSISKSAILKYHFAEELPTINGDATQIRQILMNLIINASEAIGDKSGLISITTGAMDCDRRYLDAFATVSLVGREDPLAAGRYVFIEVADTGCGMDQETIDKVFDPFFTTKFTGRGLGMAAVLGIVHGHGGAIKIYSEVKKGTTFKIIFPAGEVVPVDLDVEEEQKTVHRMGGGLILLVDDEESLRAVGIQMIERLGFSVITAADGREAVSLFSDHADEIVCVLLDLTMPRMGGKDAFSKIRNIRNDIPVIICSGYNELEVTQEFAGKSLVEFLQKPYRSSDLQAKIKKALPG